MLNVKDMAIDFTLPNQDGENISLKDFLGKKIVLYFYPRDNTSGCTTEACSIRDVYDDILDLGAIVLGVSGDTQSSHTKFKDKYQLPFHLLADTEKEVCKLYDAWGEKKMYGKAYMGIKRVTYLIDEEGYIVFVWSKVFPKKHAEEILNALKSE